MCFKSNLLQGIGVFLLASMPFIVSCEQNNQETPQDQKTPQLVLQQESYSISGDGGTLTIPYSIINAVEGTEVEVRYTAEWIEGVEVDASNILFSIAANQEYTPRSTEARISYEGATDSHIITITQEGIELSYFDIEVSNIVYNSFSVKATPEDDQQLYIINTISTDYFRMSGAEINDDFIHKEMENFASLAKQNQITLEEFLWNNKLAAMGTASRTFSGIAPLSQYAVYCYGIELNGEDYTISVPIHHTIVDIPMPDFVSAVFNARTTVSGTTVNIEAQCSVWNGHFYIQIAPETSIVFVEPGNEVPQSTIKRMSDSFYATARNAIRMGSTAESFLRTQCYQSSCNIPVSGLEPNTRYMAIFFAVRSDNGAIPVMCSEPTLAYFSTDK